MDAQNVVNTTASHANTIIEYTTKILRPLDDLDILWSAIPLPKAATTSIVMISVATATVYFASMATLEKPKNAETPDRDSDLFHPCDLETSHMPDRIEQSEAYWMPVAAGIGLVGMYCAIKYLDKTLVQKIIKYYIGGMTFFALSSLVALTIKSILRTGFNGTVPYYAIVFGKDPNFNSEIESPIEKDDMISKAGFDMADLIGCPLGLFIEYLHWQTGHWTLTNLIGVALSISGIRILRLSTFKVGLTVLAGLFAYDIFFVFGTDVMMTVALTIEAPIKLEVPRPPRRDDPEDLDISRRMSILGLGDIVVPALFISLLLRFDLWRYHHNHPGTEFHLKRPFCKQYFYAGIAAYIFGLVMTIIVMYKFESGQPALLYLSPAVGLSGVGMAWLRGELDLFFSYSESPEEDETDKDESESEKVAEQTEEKDQEKSTSMVNQTAVALDDQEDYDSYSEVDDDEINDSVVIADGE